MSERKVKGNLEIKCGEGKGEWGFKGWLEVVVCVKKREVCSEREC